MHCQKTVFLKSQRLDDLDALLDEEPAEDLLSEDSLSEDPELDDLDALLEEEPEEDALLEDSLSEDPETR
ncbi:hypothetical protein [Pseudoalteromonas xiamenensis]|uniref:Uncharacterized protein n=1 Tax=Pseudoalteromonas xiamenensis TaxID=882626 RepID=A0A975DI71_9GAMM|nr:hypothetical protein [Pseudoalteromonas xiamenensis]QTH72019.1 hypothetical protein J5O05_03670 [Pseudoalteromonas xiamenensis]